MPVRAHGRQQDRQVPRVRFGASRFPRGANSGYVGLGPSAAGQPLKTLDFRLTPVYGSPQTDPRHTNDVLAAGHQGPGQTP